MVMFNLFHHLKSQKAKQLRKSSRKHSSDYATVSTMDSSSLNSNSVQSFEAQKMPDIHELEYILESTNRSRYSEQDVHLSMEQELDLEFARLAGLLERGEKQRLTSQDFTP
ncbi:hypothetical protein K493DRAFT_382247 [Basidiobolus meristosporus CBS 931.73]|uniref:Uncharacterized protein n=1 Tax=Basidiobolus meristosporus CBS 931.73 TaxID=1314790 RepID=A0A1Y1XVN4_9FUNG|nr:hypothetical protein K493DRAFT_382247 [Basidiobolus meristosporus CBS 931.73]|eukprot:ORX89735.1 hypothetical protein K493DRAFT_382247 [Basidiobolus meristosporus CBS 931.73]